MPKQRITKEIVVSAAFEIARTCGMEQVMVKTIAEKIGCSVQPIYSYCKNMDSLRQEVAAKARSFVREYAAKHTDGKASPRCRNYTTQKPGHTPQNLLPAA